MKFFKTKNRWEISRMQSKKFQKNTINLGGNNKEDYVHTKEAADKIYDQGNVELVGTTSNDENHSMPRVPETHHWKKWSDVIVDTQFGQLQTLLRKFRADSESCVNHDGKYSLLREGWTLVFNLGRHCIGEQKMHCEEPLNMDGNVKMTGLFLIDRTRIILFSTSSIWAARMDNRIGKVFGWCRPKLSYRTQRPNPSVTGLTAM